MIRKEVKAKKSIQKKGEKEYEVTQLYLNFTKDDRETLDLQEGDEIYISKESNGGSAKSEDFKDALLFCMRFFQKNKANLELSESDKTEFREIVRRLKNE